MPLGEAMPAYGRGKTSGFTTFTGWPAAKARIWSTAAPNSAYSRFPSSPDARVEEVERYGRDEAGAEGSIRRARFTIGGQSVPCTDSVVKHSFSFTPSFSFFVECGYEDEVRRLSHVLKEGGSEMMPVGGGAALWCSRRG